MPDAPAFIAPAENASTDAPGARPTPEPHSDGAPPWGSNEEFNPDIAWSRIRQQARDIDALRLKLKEAEPKLAEYNRLEQASKTELERATEEVTRWQTEAEKWRGASVASTVKALAAKDFADPDDAVRNLDPAKYLGAGGEVDEKAIQADLSALLEAKPHYRRTAETTTRVPAPKHAQGSGSGKPAGDPGTEFAGILGGLLAR